MLTFKKMIAPVIVRTLFWIGAGVVGVAGLIRIGSGLSSSYGGVARLVFARVYCELLILFFRMYETLGQIRDGLAEVAIRMRGQHTRIPAVIRPSFKGGNMVQAPFNRGSQHSRVFWELAETE